MRRERECIHYPESVTCSDLDCGRCGWNPDVAKARLENFGKPKAKLEHKTQVYFGEWISVEKMLPKDNEQVLAFTQTGRVMSLHTKNGKWCTSPNIEVSYWMPMPNPPKEVW